MTETIYLIVSKDRKLIAKGVPRSRYICHIDEKTNKRLLTYASKGKAEAGFIGGEFGLTQATVEYIRENYPQYVRETGLVFWSEAMEELFEAVEFKMTLEEVKKNDKD